MPQIKYFSRRRLDLQFSSTESHTQNIAAN